MYHCTFVVIVVVIGDSGVGKSNLITRFTQDRFTKDSKPTIGVEFGAKSIEYDGITIKGQIWDTAGQERFRAISAAYYRGANGALICYDITNPESFQNLTKWFKEIENQGENGCINILIGNKCDLAHLRQVDTEEARKFAEKHNVSFLETSAANNTNVELAFTMLLKEIYKAQKKGKKTDADNASGGGGGIGGPLSGPSAKNPNSNTSSASANDGVIKLDGNQKPSQDAGGCKC
jgi:small GTP-binding protein